MEKKWILKVEIVWLTACRLVLEVCYLGRCCLILLIMYDRGVVHARPLLQIDSRVFPNLEHPCRLSIAIFPRFDFAPVRLSSVTA